MNTQEKQSNGFQMKTYDELSIVDNFIFAKVMSKPEICKEFLEIVLDTKIKSIAYPEDEKSISIAAESKSVRLDVYVDDDQGTIYNIEMQASPKYNLPKRSRYYQAMIDLNLLEKGADYAELNESFIIFICTFDLFDQGRHVYRFKNCCLECPELVLRDDATKIFINTKGVMDDIDDEFNEMLKVFNGEKGTSDYAQKLIDHVNEVKSNKKWRREYMQLWEIEKERYQEGLEAGRSEGIELGRSEGLELGRSEGLELGRSEGLELGRNEGIELGRSEGLELGRSEGIELGRSEGLELGRNEGEKQKERELLPLMIEMSIKLTGDVEQSIKEVASTMAEKNEDEIRAIWLEYKANKDK